MTAPIAASTLGIILVVFAVLVLLLLAGGWMAATRRAGMRERRLLHELDEAEQALAKAHAMDKGWDRALLDAAARDAAAERFGSTPINAMHLVQVIDRPGTDADQAVFQVVTEDGAEHRMTLGRSGGVWGPA